MATKLTATDLVTLAYEDTKDSAKCYITTTHKMAVEVIKTIDLYWQNKLVHKIVFNDKHGCTVRIERRRTEADNFKVGA